MPAGTMATKNAIATSALSGWRQPKRALRKSSTNDAPIAPAHTAIPNATMTRRIAGSGKCAGSNNASSSNASNKPTATNAAPRNAHTARGPVTKKIDPRTTPYNKIVTDESAKLPTSNCANPNNPRLRPDSTGAPVSASHHPERRYVADHGMFKAIAATTMPAVTPTHRRTHFPATP